MMDTMVMKQNIVYSNPIDVYRVTADPYTLEWVLLCVFLTTALIIFILLWAFSANNEFNNQGTVCYGPFGIQAGVDANVLNLCGTNNTNPCQFAVNSILAAESQCNVLQSICDAFTFDFSTSTMKIVNSSTIFTSPSVNLFVRQPGLV